LRTGGVEERVRQTKEEQRWLEMGQTRGRKKVRDVFYIRVDVVVV
jgi:hypothetical protein